MDQGYGVIMMGVECFVCCFGVIVCIVVLFLFVFDDEVVQFFVDVFMLCMCFIVVDQIILLMV